MLRVFYWLRDIIFGGEQELDRGPRERHTYMAALTGTYALNDPLARSGPAHACKKIGLWFISGNGRTAGRRVSAKGEPVPEIGKEAIHLNERLCHSAELLSADFPPGFEFVILGAPFFVATPRAERPVTVTTKVEITSVPVEGPYFVTDAFGETPLGYESKDVKVIVHTWLDGRPAGQVEFDWMAVIEVGVKLHVPG